MTDPAHWRRTKVTIGLREVAQQIGICYELALRNACLRTRRFSARLYLFSLAMLLVGGWFAFVAPWLAGVETG
ncbi:MAG: hypothetical protein ACKOCJ_09135 [Burkholderiaceae bacterium]